MSNGELNPPFNPMRDVNFDGPTLQAVLAPELGAVQDAQGDVRGAHQRLLEQVQSSQREVLTAENALTAKQQAVMARVEDLELIGRRISFESGMSLGEIRVTPRSKGESTYMLPVSKDLAGVKGTITKTEIGAKTGRGDSGSDEVLLHVAVKGSIIPPRAFRRYVVGIDDAVFSIAEAPPTADY